MEHLPHIDPAVEIGHVHLRVADLDRALVFWSGVLGFESQGRIGDGLAFLSAGGYHHHVALNATESRGGPPPGAGTTGLHHVALRYPTRGSLARAVRRVMDARVPLSGARDHGGSEAVYLDDPDGNGVELTWDRPRREWPRHPDGRLELRDDPLDLAGLLAEIA